MAKKELYDAFFRAGQGMWVKKPPEAEQFEMTFVPVMDAATDILPVSWVAA